MYTFCTYNVHLYKTCKVKLHIFCTVDLNTRQFDYFYEALSLYSTFLLWLGMMS